MEGLAANNLIARDGRAPVLFDVLANEIRAREVVHERFAAGIVHRVGQVAEEHHILAELHHLANGEGASQHAHVLMDAHNDDVGDTTLVHEVKGLDVVRDGVSGCDLTGVDLVPPG